MLSGESAPDETCRANRSEMPTIRFSNNYKWYAVAMLWWIAFFNYADRQTVFSLFPLLSREFHLDDVQLGLLGSSFAAVYGISAPFVGFLVDRVQRKASILGGLRIWSVICMATAVSRSFAQLLIFRAAEGLGETIYFPASMSFIGDYHGKATRSRAMGAHQTSVYIGTIAGGFFAGLIGQRYGWRWSFIVFGAAGIVLSFILSQLLVEPARGSADLAGAGIAMAPENVSRGVSVAEFFRLIYSRPSLALCMGAFTFQNFTTMVLFTWMPTLLYRKFHLSLAMAGLTATIYVQSTSMIGSPLGGWIADSLRRRIPGGRMLVQGIAAGLEVPFVAAGALTGSWPVLIASLSLWGIFKGFYEANIYASAFDVVPPQARGAATGFMNMVGWLGGAGSAPVVVGVLAGHIGLSRSVAATSGAYAAACILMLVAALVFARRDTHAMESALA
jgi:MFS family permease